MSEYGQKNASFYFKNLCADVARCIVAAQQGDGERYEDSLVRARRTLANLRKARRPEAYEEGLLLLRGLEYAKEKGGLEVFLGEVNKTVLVAGV